MERPAKAAPPKRKNAATGFAWANRMCDVFVVEGQPPLATCGVYIASLAPTVTPPSRHRYLRNFAAAHKSWQTGLLWRAGLSERRIARAGLRSSPGKPNAVYQVNRSGWFWGCFAAQRGVSPLATGGASVCERCVDTDGGFVGAAISAQQLTHGNNLLRYLDQLLLAAHGLAAHQGVGLFLVAVFHFHQ